MAFALSDDLIQLVIEEVSKSLEERRAQDLVSCCLSRSFVRPGQKALFHSVDVYPNRPERRHETKSGYQRTLAWANAINNSPHLAHYVRQVAIWISSKLPLPTASDNSNEGEIAHALENLSMLYGLSLCTAPPEDLSFPTGPASYDSSVSSQMKSVLASMMRNSGLRCLSLANILAFPADLVLGASQLEVLELTRSDISLNLPWKSSSFIEDREDSGNLKTLAFNNSPAALPGINNLLSIFGAPGQLGLRYRRINRLNLVICSLEEAAILEKVECLQKLYIETGPPPAYMGLEYAPPFGSLNPRSFSTLSVLHLSTKFDVDSQGDTLVVPDPYLGLCNDLLGNLHELEVLEVTVHFHNNVGDLLLDPSSLGSQWGRLADVLMVPGAFPQLKSVSLIVVLQVDDGDDIWLLVDAVEVKNTMKARVYDAQLSRLHDLEIAGLRVDFSFDVVIGPI